MKDMKRYLALGLAGVLTASMLLVGCGGSDNSGSGSNSANTPAADTQTAADNTADNAGDTANTDNTAAEDPYFGKSTEFSFLTLGSVDSIFYNDFGENPAAQFWADKEWDSNGDGQTAKITVDWLMMPESDPSDYVNTLMGTGEYPDVLPLSYVSDSLYNLYDEGVILDLTDLIPQYMPNLWAWLQSDASYIPQMSVEYEGEQKILYLPDAHDAAEDAWGSYNYRRDWLVKYGTNPETGEAFTGGYDDDGEWSDDVVFPSGNTDPFYISDWEWMFDIFQKAIDDQGISEGYAFQNVSSGFVGTGDLASGFNVHIGYSGYYFNKNGEVGYGWTEDNTRAFIECMRHWYEEGWMNQDFEENTQDPMWFQTDTQHVFTGQVGLWYGLISQWGNSLDTGTSEYTDGICVFAAPQPINDVYGDADCQGYEPDMFYKNSVLGKGEAITNRAEDKDLGTLLTAIDYLYSKEGGLLRYMGFSDVQMEEIRAEHPEWLKLYDEYDIPYAYEITQDDSGNEIYVRNNDILNIGDNLKVALNFVRTIGMTTLTNVDFGYVGNYAHNMEMANMYAATAPLNLLTDKMDADLADEKSLNDTNCNTYIAQAVPDFITGRADITDDAAWEEFKKNVASYGGPEIAEALNELAGN